MTQITLYKNISYKAQEIVKKPWTFMMYSQILSAKHACF